MGLVKEFTEQVMWPDLLAVAGAFPELATFGQGVGNFLTWGLLEDKSQDPYKRVFPRGAIFDKQLKVEKVDPAEARLYTQYSYYDDSMGKGKKPFDVGQKAIKFDGYRLSRATSSPRASTTGPARRAIPTRAARTCRWRSAPSPRCWSPT